jgi:hypothetical protein
VLTFKEIKHLPHINWQSTTVNTNPQYGKALNDKMVEITNNSDLTQVINVPTRRQNILDLLMTTNPSLISNTEVHPGMSDHEIVIADKQFVLGVISDVM